MHTFLMTEFDRKIKENKCNYMTEMVKNDLHKINYRKSKLDTWVKN